MDIRCEAMSADDRYGGFHSTHEGLGVLAEEIDELCEAIRSNKLKHVYREAVQVSAVALRIADACKRGLAEFKVRSGAA